MCYYFIAASKSVTIELGTNFFPPITVISVIVSLTYSLIVFGDSFLFTNNIGDESLPATGDTTNASANTSPLATNAFSDLNNLSAICAAVSYLLLPAILSVFFGSCFFTFSDTEFNPPAIIVLLIYLFRTFVICVSTVVFCTSSIGYSCFAA